MALRAAQLGEREAEAAETQLAGSGAGEGSRFGGRRESQPLARRKGSVRSSRSDGPERMLGFLRPVFCIAGITDFGFDSGNRLQKELAIVGERKRILTGDAASYLMKKILPRAMLITAADWKLPMEERMSAAMMLPCAKS